MLMVSSIARKVYLYDREKNFKCDRWHYNSLLEFLFRLDVALTPLYSMEPVM